MDTILSRHSSTGCRRPMGPRLSGSMEEKINELPPKTVPPFVLKLNLQQKLGIPATAPMGSTSGDTKGQKGVLGVDSSMNLLSIMGQQCTYIF